jgi:DNA-binding GntR family transcriptional regulator
MSSDVNTRAEISPVSMAEAAYRTIRDQLVLLQIRPGAPINDAALASSLDIGRTPVREALKRLETERLVVAYPRRGTFATEVNITDLGHIFEVRQVLEPVGAAKAARRASAPDRDTLSALLTELADTPDDAAPESLMRLDLRIHRAIYAAMHNPFLEDTLLRYDNLATRIWCLFVDRLPGMAGHVGEHLPLLQAIVDGDEDGAHALAADHVAHFEQGIRGLL